MLYSPFYLLIDKLKGNSKLIELESLPEDTLIVVIKNGILIYQKWTIYSKNVKRYFKSVLRVDGLVAKSTLHLK